MNTPPPSPPSPAPQAPGPPVAVNPNRKGQIIWRNMSGKVMAISIGVVIIGFFYVVNLLLRWMIGLYYLFIYYILTARGSSVTEEPCYRVQRVRYPWQDLTNTDWFLLQRCRGIEWGFSRQGETLTSSRETMEDIIDNSIFSPILIIGGLFLFVYKFVPCILRLTGSMIFEFLHGQGSFAKVFVVTSCVSIVPLYHFSATIALIAVFLLLITFIMIFIDHRLYQQNLVGYTRNNQNNNPVLLSFMELIGHMVAGWNNFWSSSTATRPPRNRWPIVNGLLTCQHHPTLCTCVDARGSLEAENIVLRDELADMTRRLERAEQQYHDILQENQDYIDRARDCQRWHVDEHQPGAPFQLLGVPTADFEAARRMISDLQSEITQILALKNREAVSYKTRIDNLQAQVNWAQGAGEDRTLMQQALEESQAANRSLNNELFKVAERAMHLKQALDKEKENHSEKCHTNAGCQRQIQELRNHLQRVISLHAEYENTVKEVAISLGVRPEVAQHYTLEQYLRAITLEVVIQRGEGESGFDFAAIDRLFKSQRGAADQTYKERLEHEVVRLGGDVAPVRIGLDSARPQKYKVKSQTYEENYQRVFPLYQKLVKHVLLMTDNFKKHGITLPEWAPDKPFLYHDNTVYLGVSTTQSKLVSREDPGKSPNSEYLERVNERLLRAEIQRWYMRGQFLYTVVRNTCSFGILAWENLDEHQKLMSVLDDSLSTVLRQVLDDLRPLSRSLNDVAPGPRMVKKFEVYMGMKAAIYGLTQIILDEHREPPAWDTVDMELDQLILREASSCMPAPPLDIALRDTNQLSAALLNGEIRTLAYRTFQLTSFIEKMQIPGGGSEIGRVFPGHIPNLPILEQKWRTTVGICMWTELARNHWQWHDAQVMKQITQPDGSIISIFDPVGHNFVSLEIPLFSRCAGLWQRFKERGWNPLGWNPWDGNGNERKNFAHSPELWESWKALDFSEPFAPWREWRYRLPDNAALADNANWGLLFLWKDKRDNLNPNLNSKSYPSSSSGFTPMNQGADLRKEALREALKVMQTRVRQLENHVIYFGVRGGLPHFPIDLSKTRRNASEESTKIHMAECQSWVQVLTERLQSAGQTVPRTLAQGGVFDPGNLKRRP